MRPAWWANFIRAPNTAPDSVFSACHPERYEIYQRTMLPKTSDSSLNLASSKRIENVGPHWQLRHLHLWLPPNVWNTSRMWECPSFQVNHKLTQTSAVVGATILSSFHAVSPSNQPFTTEKLIKMGVLSQSQTLNYTDRGPTAVCCVKDIFGFFSIAAVQLAMHGAISHPVADRGSFQQLLSKSR